MNLPNVIAFDRASVRSFDTDGRLHVSRTHISKANVCPYYGQEIPGWQELGLKADGVYRMYRDPAELESGASTFNNLPVLRKHIQVSASDPQKDEVVGSIGSDVAFEAPYLDASLCVWDAEAIAAIESDQVKELSSAYHYDPVMQSGVTPDGEQYDGRMTNIRGNHVALVEVGRAGPDVVVADSDPFTQKQEPPAMKQTKLGRALLVALSAASPKIAQDSALPGLVGSAVKSKFDSKAVRAKLCAMDEDMDPQQIDDIIDAVLGVEQTPEPMVPPKPAVDEDDDGAGSKHAEIIDFLKGKGLSSEDLEAVGNMLTRLTGPFAKDEDPAAAGYVKQDDVTAAMDSMRADLLKSFRDLEKAKSAVRPTVGDVLGMDSAEDVYRFALKHMGVDATDVPAAGLATLYGVAAQRNATPAPRIAADSASVTTEIPGLARFKR